MKTLEDLLGKYYNGETTLEEEKQLKQLLEKEEIRGAEQDMFGFFDQEGTVPEDLENQMMAAIERKSSARRTLIRRLVPLTSAAAVLLIVLSVYLNVRSERNSRMEDNFFVMEQALYQVSESLQPQEQQQMLVLWVDENTEIIIN